MKLLSELPRAAATTKLSKSSTAELGPDSPIQFVKGIGPKRADLFRKLQLFTAKDLLFHFPFRFEDRRRVFTPSELEHVAEGSLVCVAANVVSVREFRRGRSGQTMLDLRAVGRDGGELHCFWFRSYQGLSARLRSLKEAVFTGTLRWQNGRPQLIHPEMEAEAAGESLNWGRIVPIYHTTAGLSQRLIRLAVDQALKQLATKIEDTIPEEVRESEGFPPLAQALADVHFPQAIQATGGDLAPAFRRFAFTEFFHYLLCQQLARSQKKGQRAQAILPKNLLSRALRQALPFRLTDAQEQALAEIRADLQQNQPMNRILQGDVGSGKTIVALLALAEACDAGLQGALVVPTETLAEQHFRSAERWFRGLPIRPVLLTGSLSKAEKTRVQEQISQGEARLVVGTHALFQDAVDWKNLGFVVIDEQHRFGVRQRLGLQNRNRASLQPHMLTMTATPIPRSLALTVFGDLAVSAITALPSGRLPIATKAIAGAERQKVYNLCQREVKAGHQAYIIYPLVENSEAEGMEHVRSVEAEFARLRQGPLKNLRLTMIHGRLSTEERQARMRAFERREFDVLLATTVIEVGIDVPNATLIAIEHAERFGLAQLHQLRGRVGRGSAQSYCCLITDLPSPEPQASGEVGGAGKQIAFFSDDTREFGDGWERLRILERSNDGFSIAEEDLRLRGPGDFLGHRQSGAPIFRLGNLVRDRQLFEGAKRASQTILTEDPQLSQPQHANLRRLWEETESRLGDTLRSG